MIILSTLNSCRFDIEDLGSTFSGTWKPIINYAKKMLIKSTQNIFKVCFKRMIAYVFTL